MSEDTVVEIGDFASLPEAEIAKSLLASHGIEVFLSVPSGGATPELGFTDGVRLRVLESQAEEAKKILAQAN